MATSDDSRVTLDEVEAGLERRRFVLVDVREPNEWASGTIPGALRIPRAELQAAIAQYADASRPVVTYCAAGTRAALAAETLRALGYANARAMERGFDAWRAEGRPVEGADDDRVRYARHLELPEVGEPGQAKLRAARVLVVGAGGLGSPAALYLAAAGVGRLGLLDPDVVDLSNLQRQVLHATSRLGLPKVESAHQALSDLNPSIDVVAMRARFTAEDADALLDGWDVVLDGTDDFATRYALNDACVRKGIPLVHGSVFRFDGQVTVIAPGGPCYRCLYPEAPAPGFAPSCRETGVLGVVPGMIGILQATETLKLLLGLGEPLVGRLLVYDAKSARVREMAYARAPGCIACGDAR